MVMKFTQLFGHTCPEKTSFTLQNLEDVIHFTKSEPKQEVDSKLPSPTQNQ